MSFPYKVDFAGMEWQVLAAGARHKHIDQDGRRIRLVEYSRELLPHWCEKGHCGYVISGEMEIEYSDAKVTYGPGDGIFIPGGGEHKHRGRVLSEKALVFFIEELPGGRVTRDA